MPSYNLLILLRIILQDNWLFVNNPDIANPMISIMLNNQIISLDIIQTWRIVKEFANLMAVDRNKRREAYISQELVSV